MVYFDAQTRIVSQLSKKLQALLCSTLLLSGVLFPAYAADDLFDYALPLLSAPAPKISWITPAGSTLYPSPSVSVDVLATPVGSTLPITQVQFYLNGSTTPLATLGSPVAGSPNTYRLTVDSSVFAPSYTQSNITLVAEAINKVGKKRKTASQSFVIKPPALRISSPVVGTRLLVSGTSASGTLQPTPFTLTASLANTGQFDATLAKTMNCYLAGVKQSSIAISAPSAPLSCTLTAPTQAGNQMAFVEVLGAAGNVLTQSPPVALSFVGIGSFAGVNPAVAGQTYLSNAITMQWQNSPSLSIGINKSGTDCQYQIDEGAFTDQPATIQPNQQVRLKMSASLNPGARNYCWLHISGAYIGWAPLTDNSKARLYGVEDNASILTQTKLSLNLVAPSAAPVVDLANIQLLANTGTTLSASAAPVTGATLTGPINGVYSLSYTPATAGTYTLTARAMNGTNPVWMSNPLVINVATQDNNPTTALIYGVAEKAAPLPNTTTPPTGTTVGAMEGKAEVAESGAANYSIPIAVPPGVAGWAPKVALSYNSQAGNGPLGIGWALSIDAPSITRCPKNYGTDGVKGAVSYNADDRFCLDGQRLVLAPEQTKAYGADGSEYMTEVDSQTKVIAKGTKGAGPQYFEVYRADGSVFILGDSVSTTENAGDARSVAPNLGTVKQWRTSEARDPSGNLMSYTYLLDGNLSYPSKISYVGTTNSVELSYEDKPAAEQITVYEAGEAMLPKKRLKQIITKTASTMVVNTYTLAYEPSLSSWTNSSRLASVQQCAGGDAGGAGVLCLPATGFEWTNKEVLASPSSNTRWSVTGYLTGVTDSNQLVTFMGGDFNGDGRSDMLFVDQLQPTSNQDNFVFCLSLEGSQAEGNATCTRWSSGIARGEDDQDGTAPRSKRIYPTVKNTHLGDFNGDGKTDLLLVAGETDLRVCLSKSDYTVGLDLSCAQWPGNFSGQKFYGTLGDINGDGKTDFAHYVNNGFWKICLSTGSPVTGFTCQNTPTALGGTNEMTAFLSDLDGDGRADFVTTQLPRDGGGLYTWLSRSTGNTLAFEQGPEWGGRGGVPIDVASSNGLNRGFVDFNGDGIQDLLQPIEGTRSQNNAFGLPVLLDYYVKYNFRFENYSCKDPIVGNTTCTRKVEWYTLEETYRVNQQNYRILFGNGLGGFVDGPLWTGPLLGVQLRKYCTSADIIYPTNGSSPYLGLCQRFNVALGLEYGDYNGDGRTDIRVQKSSGISGNSQEWMTFLSTGKGISNTFEPVVLTQRNLGGALDLYGVARSTNIEVRKSTDGYLVSSVPKENINIPVDSIKKITNGLGASTAFNYQPITNNRIYQKGTDANTPAGQVNIQSPLYVVATSIHSDGLSDTSTYSNEYAYQGLRSSTAYAKSLGFAGRLTKDNRYSWYTETNYQQDPLNSYLLSTLYGTPNTSEIVNGLAKTFVKTSDCDAINATRVVITCQSQQQTLFTTADGKKQPRMTKQVQRKWNIDANSTYAELPKTTTTVALADYDAYNNPLKTRVETSDGFTTTTQTEYDNITANSKWIIGKSKKVSVQRTSPDDTAGKTQTTAYAYHQDTGLLKTQTLEPNGNSDVKLVSSYTYDKGNLTQETVGTRATKYAYTLDGRFLSTKTNPIGHVERFEYAQSTGQLLKHTQINGTVSQTSYDKLGRKFVETAADDTQTLYTYTGGPSVGLIKQWLETENTSGHKTRTGLDMLGRTVREETLHLNGSFVGSTIAYNAKGLEVSRTLPESSVLEKKQYDILDRVRETRTAEGSATDPNANRVVTTTYTVTQEGGMPRLTVTAYQSPSSDNPIGAWDAQIFAKRYNSQGQLLSVETNKNITYPLAPSTLQTFKYDANGNQTHTIDTQNNSIVMEFDARGRKTKMTDPDMGVWTYAYNPYGELTSQTDAIANTTTQRYDPLGRLSYREEKLANGRIDLISNWVYDVCLNGTGQLCTSNAYTPSSTSTGSREQTRYDTLGRPIAQTLILEGKTYTSSIAYNNKGQIKSKTYPHSRLSLNYRYTNGTLYSISNASTNTTLWVGSQRNNRHQITQEEFGGTNFLIYALRTNTSYDTLGRITSITSVNTANTIVNQNNSFTWDKLGNLKSRSDNISGSENFAYDTFNRLTTRNNTVEYSYDLLGNIKSSKDASAYQYANGRPHAISSVKLNSNPTATTYSYNGNGAITGRSDGLSVGWTSYGQIQSIGRGNTQLAFTHDDDHQRTTEVRSNGTTSSRITFVRSLAGLVEVTDNFSTPQPSNSITSTEVKHYLEGGNGTFADYTVTLGSAGQQTSTDLSYWHKDHLGSLIRTSSLTGTVQNSYAYAPFGARQQSQTYNANGTISPITGIPTDRRGFTGHEMLDELGLVHMNGRVYDPVIGRFLSPDPTIQFPEDMQSYNRYSYVRNNPLSVTDPTGYWEAYQPNPGSEYNTFAAWANWHWLNIGSKNPIFNRMASGRVASMGVVSTYQIIIGIEAHQLLQGRVSLANAAADSFLGDDMGYFTEKGTAFNSKDKKVSFGGRVDVGNNRIPERIWELKADSAAGIAAGHAAINRYTTNSGFSAGNAAEILAFGDTMTSLLGSYKYRDAGKGLVVYKFTPNLKNDKEKARVRVPAAVPVVKPAFVPNQETRPDRFDSDRRDRPDRFDPRRGGTDLPPLIRPRPCHCSQW